MIYYNGKDIVSVHYGGKAISYIYRHGRLVWQAIRSCFGAGFWTNDKSWLNEEGYKD